MKLMHLADLHIGKRVNGYFMTDDQIDALRQIESLAKEQKVDAVLMAGDVYDRPVPPLQAVNVMDRFLTNLNDAGIEVFMIGGNHDSVVRLSFISTIAERQGLHIARPYGSDGPEIEKHVLEDSHGKLNVYMLPFIAPSDVRRFFDDIELGSYDDAAKAVVNATNIDVSERNVLLAHQLVVGSSDPERCDSEEINIGGLDMINASVFSNFDYVALGHLHSPQWVVRNKIRYCGSPLKYSFSEINQKKSISIINIGGKGEVSLEEHFIAPPHEMHEVRGTMREIREIAKENPGYRDSYIRAVLTESVSDAASKLRDLFPYLMKIEYEFGGNSEGDTELSHERLQGTDPVGIFQEFFAKINGAEMSDEELAAFKNTVSEIPRMNREDDDK